MLRLRTLGGLSLDGIEGPLGTAGTKRRRLALLALLAAAGERGVSRDKLLAYLWPDTDHDRARHALSEMLSAMRKDLATDRLFHGTADVRVDRGEFTSDAAEFEDALDRRELSAAVALYGGPFLDGFTLPDAPEFQRWSDRERLRLEQRFRGALESLASDAKAAGEHQSAARWWRRLAEIDPLSTHVAIEVMSALAAGGDHAAAVAHGEAHERRMREEFGAPPNQAVRAFAERLKSEPEYSPPAAPRASAPTRRSTGRISAPSERDISDDNELPMSTSRERGATIAGRYLVQREIGRGGMATVFLARDLKHDRDVALKFIHAELADAFGMERFQSEIAVLAKLQHPHILPLYDSGEVEGALYYVMPFVGGESLRDRLQRESALPIPEALRLAREVADALQYAHGQGVIHRDVKPENILLTNGHALVADFGIARAVSRAAGRRNTEDGFAVGTPAYMSPEQASGDPIDGRSDEYALACVLYEMLGGAPPFVGTSGRSVLAQRFTEKPAPVRKARDSVPPEVDAALQKALARVPADRFNTVSEFAQALDVMDTTGKRRAAPSQLLATLGKFKWLVVIAAALAVGTWYLATKPPATTPGLYVVLPFRHDGDAAPRLLNGDVCQRLLYDALNGWTGLKLVDGMRAQDAKRQKSDTALTQQDAIGIAKGLGAEWLIWGDVSQIGHQITVQGKVYQVASGDVVKRASVQIDSSLTDVELKFGELADSLILPSSSAADHGTPGTRDIAALTAYAHAHEALAAWDLAPAESLFRAATLADPAFAKAHFWLAQVMSWENYGERNDWNETAARAYAMHQQLGSRDSARAQALSELAAHEYPAACKHYQEMAARDTLDFAAWYGLADCNRRDRTVIKDAKSPSGWAFRGSYQRAVSAYEHALRIVPSVHLAFAGLGYDRLSRMLFTQPVQLRRGFTLKSDSSRRGGAATSDTLWFGAYASLAADTLAFVPYPFAQITAGTAPMDSSADAAVAANRQRLLGIAKSWKAAFPHSAAAWESMARALEASGQLAGSDENESAAAAMMQARSYARTRGDSVRTGMGAVRILLESARYADARALGDSVLALTMRDPDAKEADEVKGVAALLGHTQLTVMLLRRAASRYRVLTPAGRELQPPLPVAASARAMLGFVVLGGPADSIVRLQQEVAQGVQSLVAPADRTAMRDAVTMLPALLSFPLRPVVSLAVPAGAGGPLPEIQAAVARGDTARARALVRAAAAEDARGLPADLSLDMRFQLAWLAAAVGDNAGAAALLDHGLGAIPSYGQYVLDNVQNPAALVRMMVLRADLAMRVADTRTSRQWASAAVALWSGADPELQPAVTRMRELLASP